MKTFAIIIIFTFIIKQKFAQETVTKESAGASIMDEDYTQTHRVTSSPMALPEQNSLIKSFWIYRPDRIMSPAVEDVDVYKVQFREPVLLTKLAKSLTFDYDPYFNKDYFEPFERRPKPVNVLTFRRNRIIPKDNFQMTPDPRSLDMAEIQSPYNSVGQYWRDII